ncbi:MAG: ABC transporter ATP-binding protein [Planctomycetota bacterium]
MRPVIETKQLRKVFGPVVAVDRISLSVAKGEILGFLGPNGAGKSTTMKMVTGFLAPTSGSISVAGVDVLAEPLKTKSLVGYLPEGAPAYPDMTPEGFLSFVARVRGLSRAETKRRIATVADLVHLQGFMRQPIETLSKGYKRRVGLAQAMLHDPDILILDEPTDGLDPNQKHEVRELIKDMAGEKCVVLSTHILEEVEAVCTRAVIIAEGKLVADGSPADLKARADDHNAVVICARGNTDGLPDALRAIYNVREVQRLGGDSEGLRCLVLPEPGAQIALEVGRLARERNLELDEFTVKQGRLDDVFRDLTQRARSNTTESQEATA